MEIGLGIDARLTLSDAEQEAVAGEARARGYTSLWTPARDDPFGLCARWQRASGLRTGISVLPLQTWSAERLVAAVRAGREAGGARCILGVGAGSVRERPIGRMRALVEQLRPALDGTSIYLGALGPRMLALAGASFDGAALNWCATEQTEWSRAQVEAGARAAGRDPRSVVIHQYIRMCVDPDVDAARQALAKMVLSYALARPGDDPSMGYRGHFTRMGFDTVLTDLEARHARGASDDELARRLPDALLARVGYWGAPAGAAAGFQALATGLDTAVVRVVPATTNSVECVRLAMRACLPA